VIPPLRESLQRLSRWIWLINGVILLSALVVTGLAMLAGWLSYGRGGADPVEQDSATGGVAMAAPVIRYDPPLDLPGSATRLVLVREGRGLPTPPIPPVGSYRAAGAVVNVALLDGGGRGRLLFDRPVRILSVSYAGAPEWLYGPLQPGASQTGIAYAVIDGDTDRDGRIGEMDDVRLYVSALDGAGLHGLLPPGHRLVGMHRLGDRWMVTTLQRQGPVRRQSSFLYDEASGLRPYTTMDSLAARAGELLISRP
jgi:hypothetical protein